MEKIQITTVNVEIMGEKPPAGLGDGKQPLEGWLG